MYSREIPHDDEGERAAIGSAGGLLRVEVLGRALG